MKLCVVLGVCFLMGGTANAQAQKTAFAYAEGHTLTIADDQGHVLNKLTVLQGIGGFGIDSSGRHVVVQTPGDYGGQLLWCSVSSKSCEPLTHGPYFYRSEKDVKEVYTFPSFSPDETRIAFAIRSLYSDSDRAKEEDAWEAQGPLAVMAVQGRTVRILKSTTGKGACFTDSPLWLPDGTRILFSCDADTGVTDQSGTRQLDVEDAMEGPPLDEHMSMSVTQPLAWAGNNAILFTRSRSNKLQDLEKSRVLQLDLGHMRVHPIKQFWGISASNLQGACQVQKSDNLVFVGTWRGEEKVYDRQTGRVVWSVQETSDQYVPVQLIGGSQTR